MSRTEKQIKLLETVDRLVDENFMIALVAIKPDMEKNELHVVSNVDDVGTLVDMFDFGGDLVKEVTASTEGDHQWVS